MIVTPEGTWSAARARIVGPVVAVMSRTGDLLQSYELDGEPVLVEGPQLVGSIGDDPFVVSVDPGCLCDQTHWQPFTGEGE